MEKADMVVKEPRKPITKNKNIGEDLLAKKPAIHPIENNLEHSQKVFQKALGWKYYCLHILLTKILGRLQAHLLKQYKKDS